MKKQAIHFRELLERLLPLDELPPLDRLRVQRALQTGVSGQIEQAALIALTKLEQRGAVLRLPTPGSSHPDVVRYQPRGSMDVITVELPAGTAREGFRIMPRVSLLPRAQARLEQVRRLLRLDDPLLLTDPRREDTRTRLREQLREAGREVLGASDLRILPPPAVEEALRVEYAAAPLAREATTHPELVYYCPDLPSCPALAEHQRRSGAQSLVLVGLGSESGKALGLIEIESNEPDAFALEDLGLIALLADYCSGVLERATHVEKMVFIDPLTAAYNRSYFDIEVEREMARAQRERSSMALCIADIDNFKTFNSTFGYQAGNHVLVQVAESLKNGVRPFDTVARWGGEEFAVLLTSPIQAGDVIAISERLRSMVEKQTVEVEALDGNRHRVIVTVSIGVALFPDHADDATMLWRCANTALLAAKRPPKNQVVFFEKPQASAPTRPTPKRSSRTGRPGGSPAGIQKVRRSISAFGGPALMPKPPSEPPEPREE